MKKDDLEEEEYQSNEKPGEDDELLDIVQSMFVLGMLDHHRDRDCE